MVRRRNNKLDKTIPEIAQIFAARFIAQYSIEAAEQVAKLIYEKIIANRKSLERRYGKK
jgi:hypothetical protein